MMGMLIATVGMTSISMAQKPELMISDKSGWHKIASTTVSFKKDKEELLVLGADRFASIKFKVTGAPIEITSLEVYFVSGDKQDIIVNNTVELAGESKLIALNGGERSLKKIIFVYKTLPNHQDEKAVVELWGLKTNTDKK